MKRFALSLLAVAVSLLVYSSPATSAVNLFLDIDDIKGESTDTNHQDWIDILAYSFGVSNAGSPATGGGGGAGKASFQDFHFTKLLDASSPFLFQAVASGKHFMEAQFEVVQASGQNSGEAFLKYKLTDILVTSFSQSSGGDIPADSFSLAFAKIDMDYRPEKSDGTLGPWIHAGWNLKTASPAPEPSTWALLIAGLTFVAWRSRRKAPVRAV